MLRERARRGQDRGRSHESRDREWPRESQTTREKRNREEARQHGRTGEQTLEKRHHKAQREHTQHRAFQALMHMG
jgi:hypothetical protein